jgi:tetratricopeptide (TPR) repeat protein
VPIIILSLVCLFYGSEIYLKSKNFGQSEPDFWLGIQNVQREDLIAKMNIAQQLLYRDEQKALAVYNDILQQKDHHQYEVFCVRVYEELALYYTQKKDLKKAEEYVNKLFQLSDLQSQFFYFTYATFLTYKGEPEEGEKIVAEILRRFPQNHQVLIHAARFYMIVEDNKRAIELLQKDYNLFRNNDTLKLLKQLEY